MIIDSFVVTLLDKDICSHVVELVFHNSLQDFLAYFTCADIYFSSEGRMGFVVSEFPSILRVHINIFDGI